MKTLKQRYNEHKNINPKSNGYGYINYESLLQILQELFKERLQIAVSVSKETLETGSAYYLLGATGELSYLLELCK